MSLSNNSGDASAKEPTTSSTNPLDDGSMATSLRYGHKCILPLHAFYTLQNLMAAYDSTDPRAEALSTNTSAGHDKPQYQEMPSQSLAASNKDTSTWMTETSYRTTTAPLTALPEMTHPLSCMLDYVQYHIPKEELAVALWSGAMIIDTAGSVKNGHGMYAFVILILPSDDEPILACRL